MWRTFQTVSTHLLLSSRFSSITNVVRRSMRRSALSHRSWFRFTASRQNRDSGTVTCSDVISFHSFCRPVIFYRSQSRNSWLYKEAFHPHVVYKAAMHTLGKSTLVKPCSECLVLRKFSMTWRSSESVYFLYTSRYLHNTPQIQVQKKLQSDSILIWSFSTGKCSPKDSRPLGPNSVPLKDLSRSVHDVRHQRLVGSHWAQN